MKQKKQFIELSDEELKQVTGGASIDCSLPENKDNIICKSKWQTEGFGWGGAIRGDFAAGIGGAAYPDSEKDEFGNCPQK